MGKLQPKPAPGQDAGDPGRPNASVPAWGRARALHRTQLRNTDPASPALLQGLCSGADGAGALCSTSTQPRPPSPEAGPRFLLSQPDRPEVMKLNITLQSRDLLGSRRLGATSQPLAHQVSPAALHGASLALNNPAACQGRTRWAGASGNCPTGTRSSRGWPHVEHSPVTNTARDPAGHGREAGPQQPNVTETSPVAPNSGRHPPDHPSAGARLCGEHWCCAPEGCRHQRHRRAPAFPAHGQGLRALLQHQEQGLRLCTGGAGGRLLHGCFHAHGGSTQQPRPWHHIREPGEPPAP